MTKEELSKLYQQRSALDKDIANAERQLMESKKLMPLLEDSVAKSIDAGITDKVIVALEYIDSQLTRIGLSHNENLFESMDIVQAVVNDDDEVEETEEDVDEDDEESDNGNEEDQTHKRTKSIPFTVKFTDGKTIYYKNAQKTMIEALRYMSLGRASQFKEETFKGFPLVGREQRITEDNHKWQHLVDGWWVYINMGNPRKIRCLEGVAKMLHIDLEIIPDHEMSALPSIQEKPKGKR
jgi:hypothetical protein